ncbi:hypothetical protein A2U01_0114892, partial [Trifolium medium]|nr:hypothetical protein [Trifolium medium]
MGDFLRRGPIAFSRTVGLLSLELLKNMGVKGSIYRFFRLGFHAPSWHDASHRDTISH